MSLRNSISNCGSLTPFVYPNEISIDPTNSQEAMLADCLIRVQVANLNRGNIIPFLSLVNANGASTMDNIADHPILFILRDVGGFSILASCICNDDTTGQYNFQVGAEFSMLKVAIQAVYILTESGFRVSSNLLSRPAATSLGLTPTAKVGSGVGPSLGGGNPQAAAGNCTVEPRELLGFTVRVKNGRSLKCDSKGGKQRAELVMATARVMCEARFEVLVKDLEVIVEHLKDRFDLYAGQHLSLPSNHHMKSTAKWPQVLELPVARAGTVGDKVFKAAIQGEFLINNWTVLNPAVFYLGPFSPWARLATRVGWQQLRVIMKNMQLFFRVAYSEHFEETFNVVIVEIDHDDEPLRAYDDILVVVVIWSQICQVFHDLRYEDVLTTMNLGLPIDNPQQVAFALKEVLSRSMRQMRENKGEGMWERSPHRDFYGIGGRLESIKGMESQCPLKSAIVKGEVESGSGKKGGGRKDKKSREGKVTTNEAPRSGAEDMDLSSGVGQVKQKKAKIEGPGGAKSSSSSSTPMPRTPATDHSAGCMFYLAHLVKASYKGATMECRRGDQCSYDHSKLSEYKSRAAAKKVVEDCDRLGHLQKQCIQDAIDLMPEASFQK